MEVSEARNSAAKSFLWKFMERIGNHVIALVVQIVLARILSPDEFGLLAVLLVFVNFANVLVQSGLNTALIQSPSVSKVDYSTVFWVSFIISIALVVLLWVAAPLIAVFYNSSQLIWPLRFLSMELPVGAFYSVLLAIVSRELKFKKTLTSTLLAVIFSGIIGIAAALCGWGIWALVLQQISSQVLSCVFLYMLVKWHPVRSFSLQRARLLYSYGWKILLSGIIDILYPSLTDLVIGKQFGNSVLGFVSQGKKYPYAIGSAIDGAIQPVALAIASKIQDDLSKVERMLRRSVLASCFCVWPLMFYAAVSASDLVSLILGEKWLPCTLFFQIYCFINILNPICTASGQVINGIGRSDLYLKIQVGKKMIGIALIFAALLVFKTPEAVVLSLAFGTLFGCVANMIANSFLVGYSFGRQLRDLLPMACLNLPPSIFAILVNSFVSLPMVLKLFLSLATFLIMYICIARLLRFDTYVYMENIVFSLIGQK